MNITNSLNSYVILLILLSASLLGAQNIPNSLSFTTAATFSNGIALGQNSVLLYDNNLSNGYDSGFDLHDAPNALNPSGPTGSAAFQWGTPANSNWAYPHSSALWFQPLAVTNAISEQTFEIGYLHYRNGTIVQNTGASRVNLGMTLNFSHPTGLDAVSLLFGSDLINTNNGNDPHNLDPVASADIVSLRDFYAPLNFVDASGDRYYLQLTFQVDQDTIDGTLSSVDEFRVFEGAQGRATLLGRFTTTPANIVVPEPSTAVLIGLAGILVTFSRRPRFALNQRNGK